jgi:hypothetical protein
MKQSEGRRAKKLWRNPRLWVACLVVGVISALVAIVIDRLWGDTAGTVGLVVTGVITGTLIGRWIDDHPNRRRPSLPRPEVPDPL